MKKFSFIYKNQTGTKDIYNKNNADLFEGERIQSKIEEVKYDDSSKNTEYDTKCYITNFRVICVSDQHVYDMPLKFIKSHYVKKTILYGSSYIYLEFHKTNLKGNLPKYILENFAASEITSVNYQLPDYSMLKFRGKDSNIDENYNILKIALNSKEWEVNILNNIFRTLI
jgi:hypothetical protein